MVTGIDFSTTRDESRMVIVYKVGDQQFFVPDTELIGRRLSAGFASLAETLIRTMNPAIDNASRGFRKLEWALMTPSQRRRWAKRFIRDTVISNRLSSTASRS